MSAFPARITLNRYQAPERLDKPKGVGGIGQPKAKGKKRHKIRPGDDRDHVKNVKLLPSIISGKPAPNDPHHLKRIGADNKRGMSVTNEDRWALPLTRAEHDDVEHPPGGDDVAYLMDRWGIDAKAICEALWRNRGNLPAMHRIIVNDLLRRGVPYAE